MEFGRVSEIFLLLWKFFGLMIYVSSRWVGIFGCSMGEEVLLLVCDIVVFFLSLLIWMLLIMVDVLLLEIDDWGVGKVLIMLMVMISSCFCFFLLGYRFVILCLLCSLMFIIVILRLDLVKVLLIDVFGVGFIVVVLRLLNRVVLVSSMVFVFVRS